MHYCHSQGEFAVSICLHAWLYRDLTKALQADAPGLCVPQNLDSRQRLLRWKPPNSTVFQVQGLPTVSKLAPGLQLSFKVALQPGYPKQVAGATRPAMHLFCSHLFPIAVHVNAVIYRCCTKVHLARMHTMLLSCCWTMAQNMRWHAMPCGHAPR